LDQRPPTGHATVRHQPTHPVVEIFRLLDWITLPAQRRTLTGGAEVITLIAHQTPHRNDQDTRI